MHGHCDWLDLAHNLQQKTKKSFEILLNVDDFFQEVELEANFSCSAKLFERNFNLITIELS